MSKETVNVIFQPSGRRGEVPKGVNIIEASRLLGVDIEAPCGEKKVCGKCIVRVEEGRFEKYGITSSMDHVSPWLVEEEKFINAERKDKGFRLGCVATVQDDILVFVPEESRAGKQIVSKAARDIQINHNPCVKSYYVQMDKPTFEEPTGDFERVCNALEREHGVADLTIDIFALRQLADALREGEWAVTVSVWNDKEVIRVLPGKREKAPYGIAIDVGTTTIAGYMCNLDTMEVIDTVSMMNPQCKYGEDVMARITYHMTTPDGLQRMSDDIIEGLNDLIAKAVEATHPPKKKVKQDDGSFMFVETPEEGKTYLCLTMNDIEDITIGFNTAMHHILLGLNPEYVGMAPFPPVIHHSMDVKARDIGVNVNPSTYLYVLPIEAGFVGADNVGVLICEQPYKYEENQLIIDVGTNGELVLGNKHKLISSSCATGPALEGAQLAFGMRAAPGAIERIDIDRETKDVTYRVIGQEKNNKDIEDVTKMGAKGICGSAILDVLAELYRSGCIRKTGQFNKKALKECSRYRKNPDTKQPEFVIAWANESSIDKDIVVTQRDVRQIQLAKGALYAGCKLMLKRMNLEFPDRVKIAGAFGTHISSEKALIMGLFPDCEVEKIEGVGNAAGDGCRAALLDVRRRVEANWCSRNVEYIELTVEETFEQDFMEAMQMPHMTDPFPHLVGLVDEDILNQ
jgi:uncharacterized 2Fe-2S/4Fe-4S cluster protein (DUF4445 family)